ncbi:MAG: EscU/YscU/HrcU family type III secretion system export apparatus switch protein [Chromatiales bacterium]|nr:EscU/YscU/HrcU family type III secretion system export apparatus switch protein [Chromatiales bacterium]
MKDDVLNPPDLAIALHYDGKGPPRITAKGEEALAERIIALAQAHDIPLHPDAQLAGLLAKVPLGEAIPEPLYLAVAEVIAFAYLLSGRRPPGFSVDARDDAIE